MYLGGNEVEFEHKNLLLTKSGPGGLKVKLSDRTATDCRSLPLAADNVIPEYLVCQTCELFSAFKCGCSRVCVLLRHPSRISLSESFHVHIHMSLHKQPT